MKEFKPNLQYNYFHIFGISAFLDWFEFWWFAAKILQPSTPMRSPANIDAQESITIGVADEHIGAVVGRAGRNITEIIQASGARIKISDRGDFMSGTTDRKVTITGTSEAIRTAESMIMQRVSASSERWWAPLEDGRTSMSCVESLLSAHVWCKLGGGCGNCFFFFSFLGS